MTHTGRQRKKKRPDAGIRVWIIMSVVLITAAWLYASRKKGNEIGEKTHIEAFTEIKGMPGDALLVTGIPESLASHKKEYEGFMVDFNADNHTPNYVGWELLAQEVDGTVKRSDNFRKDPDVKGCPDISDYRRSGYDRGHMYPAADAKWSAQSMDDCFYFTNMAPQSHSLNNGAWKTLEDKERLWARRDGRLIIVAGPIYTSSDATAIGPIGVRVPSGFFKVLLAPDVEKPRAIAFVYPNNLAPGNMQNYSMTVDEAEVLTGFDFFPELPDEIENEIESTASFKEWNRR